jgi:thioredoxin-like negative regulator of GroEL
MLAKVLEDITDKPDIEVVDIDSDSDKAQQFKIRGVPTLVMLHDDVEVKRVTGMQTQQQLEEWFK